jgi:hypothetical protein
MAIYQLHANATAVTGSIVLPIALGWFCDTDDEANTIAAAVDVGFSGTNGETYLPATGDLVRVRGSDELRIIRSNGTIKKI